MPRVTILLDLDPVVGVGRIDRAPDRLERAGDAFHLRTREAYLELAAAEPERWVVVDAARPVDEVHDEVRRAVAERLGLEATAFPEPSRSPGA